MLTARKIKNTEEIEQWAIHLGHSGYRRQSGESTNLRASVHCLILASTDMELGTLEDMSLTAPYHTC